MVRKCMVLFCKNNKPPLYHLTSNRYLSWMMALGRNPDIEKLGTGNVVCSAHFTEADFTYVGEKKSLKPDAVPSLNLGQRQVYNTNIGASSSQTRECSDSEKYCALYKHKYQYDNENKENLQQSSCSSEIFLSYRIPEMNIASDIPATPGIYSTTFRNSGSYDDEIFQEYDFPHEIAQNVDISNENRSSPISMPTSSPERQNFCLKRELVESSSDSEGYRGMNKKIRRDVKIYHNYSAWARTLKKAFREVTNRKKTYQHSLKKKKQQVKRLQQKVAHLKDVVVHLKKKQLISDNAITALETSLSGLPLSLI